MYEQKGQRSGCSDIPTEGAQMHCSPSAFIMSCFSGAHQCTKTDGTLIGWSVFSSHLFVQVFALVLLLRNSWCCFKRSNPESVHAVDRSFHSLWWGTSQSWREDVCWDHVTVHDMEKHVCLTHLPQPGNKFTLLCDAGSGFLLLSG